MRVVTQVSPHMSDIAGEQAVALPPVCGIGDASGPIAAGHTVAIDFDTLCNLSNIKKGEERERLRLETALTARRTLHLLRAESKKWRNPGDPLQPEVDNIGLDIILAEDSIGHVSPAIVEVNGSDCLAFPQILSSKQPVYDGVFLRTWMCHALHRSLRYLLAIRSFLLVGPTLPPALSDVASGDFQRSRLCRGAAHARIIHVVPVDSEEEATGKHNEDSSGPYTILHVTRKTFKEASVLAAHLRSTLPAAQLSLVGGVMPVHECAVLQATLLASSLGLPTPFATRHLAPALPCSSSYGDFQSPLLSPLALHTYLRRHFTTLTHYHYSKVNIGRLAADLCLPIQDAATLSEAIKAAEPPFVLKCGTYLFPFHSLFLSIEEARTIHSNILHSWLQMISLPEN